MLISCFQLLIFFLLSQTQYVIFPVKCASKSFRLLKFVEEGERNQNYHHTSWEALREFLTLPLPHVCIYACVCAHACVCAYTQWLSRVWVCAKSWAVRLLCPWNFPGKNTGVGCHFLPRDWTCISCVSCFGRWILYHCTTGRPFLFLLGTNYDVNNSFLVI